MSEKRVYKCIDVFKIICALLIVFSHTFCYDFKCGFWIRNILSNIGVPFFFITSGFFYGIKLRDSNNSGQAVRNYLYRLIIMYSMWSLITLPISWWNISLAYPESSFIFKALYMIRSYFLSGSLGIYWYLLALILSSAILFCFIRRKKENILLLLSLLFFAVGVIYNSGVIDGSALYHVIHVLFSSERNFLNVGLFYVTLGYFISKNNCRNVARATWMILFIISIAVDTFLYRTIPFHFMQAFSAFTLFNFARNIDMPISYNASSLCRKISTAIYLIHFPFILLFDYYLKRGTYIDFPLALLVSILIYFVLNTLMPRKVIKALFG